MSQSMGGRQEGKPRRTSYSSNASCRWAPAPRQTPSTVLSWALLPRRHRHNRQHLHQKQALHAPTAAASLPCLFLAPCSLAQQRKLVSTKRQRLSRARARARMKRWRLGFPCSLREGPWKRERMRTRREGPLLDVLS